MGELQDKINFEWDENKNAINIKKHGISFDEASTVFYDVNALFISDPDHSDSDEERFIILGASKKPELLTVCHCFRKAGSVIRIISARHATKQETMEYFESL